MPDLGLYIRIEGLILILNAICIVQMNLLIRDMRFKLFFFINLISVLISIIVSIECAIKGLGVWSLIIRDLLKEFILMVLLLASTSWSPHRIIFSKESFKTIFKYSFPILLASLTRRVYDSAQALVIGRSNSTIELGYYTQAKKMEEVPVSGYADAASQVLFPALSREYEKDFAHGNELLQKNIRLLNFCIIPIIAIVELCALPIFHILFGEKWNGSIPMFQILCLAGITIPAVKASCEALKAVGRSDLFFSIQLIQRLLGIAIIIISARWGLYYVLWALVLNSIVFFISNMYFNKTILGYPYQNQLRDILGYLLLGTIVYCIIYFCLSRLFNHHDYIILLLIPIIYFSLYWGISYLLKLQVTKDIINIVNKLKHA